jgi:hypothetical protein
MKNRGRKFMFLKWEWKNDVKMKLEITDFNFGWKMLKEFFPFCIQFTTNTFFHLIKINLRSLQGEWVRKEIKSSSMKVNLLKFPQLSKPRKNLSKNLIKIHIKRKLFESFENGYIEEKKCKNKLREERNE